MAKLAVDQAKLAIGHKVPQPCLAVGYWRGRGGRGKRIFGVEPLLDVEIPGKFPWVRLQLSLQ